MKQCHCGDAAVQRASKQAYSFGRLFWGCPRKVPCQGSAGAFLGWCVRGASRSRSPRAAPATAEAAQGQATAAAAGAAAAAPPRAAAAAAAAAEAPPLAETGLETRRRTLQARLEDGKEQQALRQTCWGGFQGIRTRYRGKAKIP